MPLWVAVAIVAAAYVGRSAIRGWDFHPDLPADAIVLALFLVIIALVAYVRAWATRDEEDAEEAPREG
jgi:hypothetical protein